MVTWCITVIAAERTLVAFGSCIQQELMLVAFAALSSVALAMDIIAKHAQGRFALKLYRPAIGVKCQCANAARQRANTMTFRVGERIFGDDI